MINADEENQNKREREEEANAEEGEKFSKIPRQEGINPKNEEMELEGKESAIGMAEEEANIQASSSSAQDEVSTCLDTLAWLLECDTASCTAVCIVNETLLISDNEIDRSTTKRKNQVKYINSVIKYFSMLLVEGKSSTEERNSILKKIYLQKLDGESKGHIRNTFDEKELEQIVDAVLKDKGDGKNISNVKKLLKHSSPKISESAEICSRALKRFKRVEDFLLNDAKKEGEGKEAETQNNSLIKKALSYSGKKDLEQRLICSSEDGDDADYEDYHWLMDSEKKGYGILAVNTGAVHAELKIIDYLFACRILTSEAYHKKSYYIGVSKKCCSGCYRIVDLINQVLNRKVLIVAGTHAQEPSNWKDDLPRFLLGTKKTEEERNSKAAGYFAVYHFVKNRKLEFQRKPLESLDNFEAEKNAFLEEISKQKEISEKIKKTLKVFLFHRDNELIEKIYTQFNDLSKNKAFHIYGHRKTKYMSHTSPEASPQKADRQEEIKIEVEDVFRNMGSAVTTLVVLLSTKQAQPDTVLRYYKEFESQLSSFKQYAQVEEILQKTRDVIAAKASLLDLRDYQLELITEEKWQTFTELLRSSSITKLIISNNIPDEKQQHLHLIIEENIRRFQVTRRDAGGLKGKIARIFFQDPNYDSNTGTFNGKPLTTNQLANEILKQTIGEQKNMGLILD